MWRGFCFLKLDCPDQGTHRCTWPIARFGTQVSFWGWVRDASGSGWSEEWNPTRRCFAKPWRLTVLLMSALKRQEKLQPTVAQLFFSLFSVFILNTGLLEYGLTVDGCMEGIPEICIAGERQARYFWDSDLMAKEKVWLPSMACVWMLRNLVPVMSGASSLAARWEWLGDSNPAEWWLTPSSFPVLERFVSKTEMLPSRVQFCPTLANQDNSTGICEAASQSQTPHG